MTLEQTETAIQNLIGRIDQQERAINVRLIQPIHRYYVIGEVNSPGAYPLTGHETVLDAIMEAGGLTNRASACDLLLARPTEPCSCRVTLPVCYRAITQLGDTSTNYHLMPGDRIFVGRQSFCEELRAYVAAGKSCERCCRTQTACGDATTANGPNFVATAPLEIPAPPPVPVDPTDQSTQPNDPLSTPSIAPSKQKSDGAVLPAPGNLPVLDGELDFESMLNSLPDLSVPAP